MLAHFHRNHVTTFKIPPTTNNSDNNTQLHLHSRWDYRLLKRWMNVKLKLLSRKLKQWFGFKDRCDVFMSNDGKSLFQSSRNTKSTLKTNSERKKLRSKYGVRLVCLHKQQQGRHDVTQYKWSEKRWKVAECISARVRLHFSLRGASPWSFSVELRGHFRSISHFHSSESESDRGRWAQLRCDKSSLWSH